MGDRPRDEAELDTWQQIATYLGISIREAQYREKSDGLPVRRLAGRKPRVWALRSELDTWRVQSGRTRPPYGADASKAVCNQIETSEPSGADTRPTSTSRRSLLVGTAAAVVSGVTLWQLVQPNRSGVSRASILGDTLCAWNGDDRILWKHRFSATLRSDLAEEPEQRLQIVNFADRGGQVVVAVNLGTPMLPAGDELYCFSQDGKVLWHYRPKFSVRFGSERFDGPWIVHDMKFATVSGKPALYVAVAHWMWRPSFVVALEATGRATIRFASAGHVYALLHMAGPGGEYLLAGGINNEYNSAALAVLRDGDPPSRSPQTRGTRFEILDGPTAEPSRYILLPPSEVNSAVGSPYNRVVRIQPDGQSFLVMTREAEGAGLWPAEALYLFDNSAEPRRVTYGEGYAVWHRKLQAAGNLGGSIEGCVQPRCPVRIREWNAMSGWATVEVPFADNIGPGAYQASPQPGLQGS